MKRALCVFVPSLLFSVNTSHAIELPTFAYTQTCTAEGGSFSNFRNCIATQRAARGNLKKNWRLYSESQKTSCVAEASGIAGVTSYVELLTCLQLDRGAAALGRRWFER
jgi:hypothetical protein